MPATHHSVFYRPDALPGIENTDKQTPDHCFTLSSMDAATAKSDD